MPVDVAWVNYNPRAIARGYWDNELPERILGGQRHYEQQGGDVLADGIVLVVPGQHNAGYVTELNALMSQYDWVLLMVTGDEEGLFPWKDLEHPNMKTWAFAPNSPDAFQADRLLPFGPTPHGFTDLPKTLDWFFAGQINTPERKAMAEALNRLPGGKLVETDGFARGLSPEDYVTVMNRARVVPCPPAWKHPDTFRVWEALDAGAVPLIGMDGYFERLGLDNLLRVHTWDVLPEVLRFNTPSEWDYEATRCKAWWIRQQYEYRRWLRADILELGGPDVAPDITVIMPTSPIESHPSVYVINETLNSVSSRLAAPVIVMCDGVRPEQEHYRPRYEEYLRELVRLPGVVPLMFEEFTHQANMTRRALELVDSEFVLFVEHDTPLVGDIPWDTLMGGLDEFDVIRLLHETDVLPEHAYLHADHPRNGFLRTQQWSQRPHLARTDYYRRIIADNFTFESRTMIEDTMHSKAQLYPEDHRIGIYYPDGSKLRSTHLDGRGSDPKFEMIP